MKHSTRIAISLLTLAAIPLLAGCESSTEQVSKTRYIALPPSQVVVEPSAPTVVTPPSTVSTTEERSSSDSTTTGNNATEERSSAYHSETSTVTPTN